MELNPYARFLTGPEGNHDPRAVLAATPGLVHQALCAMTPEQVEAPYTASPAPTPPKWSPREIVAHLADCEFVFAFRLRQTLAEDSPTLQPFDQSLWAHNYAAYDLPSALEAFRAARAWNLRLIGSLPASAFARPATHPERGTMTFQTIVETMAGHDLNHLQQLQSVLKP